MNNLTTQFQAAFEENKKAAKSYKKYEKADQVAQEVINQVTQEGDPTLRYLVIYLPKLERFCICFLIMIQTSYLTPPMAPAIFYLRGISPPEITLMHMYKGVVPFIFLHFIVLTCVILYPQLALWLPTILFRGFG